MRVRKPAGMTMKHYNTANISEWAKDVAAGETVSLSGVIYTARDAAHKKCVKRYPREKHYLLI